MHYDPEDYSDDAEFILPRSESPWWFLGRLAFGVMMTAFILGVLALAWPID